MKKMPVKINQKELPIDSRKRYKVVYDYRKRNSGGFVDALILGTIMFTGLMWIMLYISVK